MGTIFDTILGKLRQRATLAEIGLTDPLQFQGNINLPADFPTLAAVQNGWVFFIKSVVTDNDGSKTNTGDSFIAGDEIAWNGTGWEVLGNSLASGVYDTIVIAGDYEDFRDKVEGGNFASIYLPDSTYLITDNEAIPLVVHPNVRLIQGESRDGVIIDADNESGSETNPLIRTILDITASNSIIVRSLTVQDLNIASVSGVQVVGIKGGQTFPNAGDGPRVYNCRVNNVHSGTAGSTHGYHGCIVENCIAGDSGVAGTGCDTGFDECAHAIQCGAHESLETGFQNCDHPTGCWATASTVTTPRQYLNCKNISGCLASNATTGFNNCDQMGMCNATFCVTGYDLCCGLTSCQTLSISGSCYKGSDSINGCSCDGGSAIGFDNCTNISNNQTFISIGTKFSVTTTFMSQETQEIEASEDLVAGDMVSLFDDAGTLKARKADATVSGKEAKGFVETAVTSGNLANVIFSGANVQLSGLTVADTLFLDTTAGGVTATAPSASGNVVQEIGTALSATKMIFQPKASLEIA